MLDTNFWEGKKVLVTGHTGFKGAWLSLWLKLLRAKVYGYALEPAGTPNLFQELRKDAEYASSIESNIGELSNRTGLKEIVQKTSPDVVIHLAAQSLVRKSYSDAIGTWETNVIGSLNVLQSLKQVSHECSVVMVTTDKVYENKEWEYGYREDDKLGGIDPYSSSKAAAELAISSWRSSYCGKAMYQNQYLKIATARSGNVLGGGDWAENRIVPDAIRALSQNKPIPVRNPLSTRPWQHVLEPLGGYLLLAQQLSCSENPPCEAFNFGPKLDSNRSVKELVETILSHWGGRWTDQSSTNDVHEAQFLNLQIDKAYHRLGWEPVWDFSKTLEKVVNWYHRQSNGASAMECSLADLEDYQYALANLQKKN